MNPPVQTIYLSKNEVDILNSIKRKTKINQWNILCRIAFCISCKDDSVPPKTVSNRSDSGVEIDWQTFSGGQSEIFSALLIYHRLNTKSDESLADYFRQLLARGIVRIREQQIGI